MAGNNSWRTRPWSTTIAPGVFATPKRDVWVYRTLPLAALEWEDAPKRLELQSRLERFLIEVGDTARDLGQGVRTLAQTRSIHILSVLYDTRNRVDPKLPPLLSDLQSRILFDTTPQKALFIGVKLRRDAVAALTGDSDSGLLTRATKALKAVAAAPTDLSLFARDYDRISNVFQRAEARVPTADELAQLTSWFNDGGGMDVVIASGNNKLQLSSGRTWQISALLGIDEQAMEMSSPGSPWLLDAMNHPEGARAVSIRSELEPATVTRGRLRHAQRVLRNQEEEESATGDIGRDEIGERQHMARVVENYTRAAGHAWLTKTSVLFAREVRGNDPDETYADVLRNSYLMDVKALEKRQLKALSEMMPGSDERVNPFGQDVNPAWVAYSGIAGFGHVGDDAGLVLAAADPHWTTVLVDIFAAANRNKSPIMGIFGEPGSGKTFAAQLICAQAALAGQSAIFINPKGHDTLKPFAQWVKDAGGSARVVSMMALEAAGGAFDPFRFAEPKEAAEILTRHINTVLGGDRGGLTGAQEVELGRGLTEGALAGARCAMDALGYVRDADTRQLVLSMVEASTLFALAFGKVPQDAWEAGSGLTLIEFDRALPLPTPGKAASDLERDERVAVAALRLVSRASLEILMRSKGGVLVVDEAHHFLGSTEGLATLDRIGREGRSLGLLPIFATQRITELVKVDMESFMSRVLAMKLSDPVEGSAAMRLCRLEATPARLAFLAQAGPGVGFFRDLDDRHSVVQVGAGVPEDLRMAMSTNRQDRIVRDVEHNTPA